ncbi:MAG: hypothetical protein Q8P52_02570 [bacterium]|nr:hypothetical protein [bacterium]
MARFPCARPLSCRQDFLYGFKQFRGKNWRKASVKPFAIVFGKSEIGTVRQHSFDGSFAKWRSFGSSYSVERQKIGEGFIRIGPFGVLGKCTNNYLRMSRMRFNVSRRPIIHIAKGSFRQPFAPPYFLAHTALHILRQIV